MLLLSWNVAGRVKRLPEQADRALELGADVVCLQEVTRSTLPRWRSLLHEAGYVGIEHGELPVAGRKRPLAVLTASRTALHAVLVDGVPWPERVLAVHLSDGTEVVNVHSPISPKPDLAKIRTHEAVHRHLADEPPGHARVLCGDLNTPRKEHADGTVWTFARDRYGQLRPDRGERWDSAELALIRGLEAYGYRDAFRLLHPEATDEISWEWARWGRRVSPRSPDRLGRSSPRGLRLRTRVAERRAVGPLGSRGRAGPALLSRSSSEATRGSAQHH